MKHTLAEDEMKELASFYALGALSQPEMLAFEEHLSEGCEVCEAEFRSFENVVGALGFMAAEAEPSAGVRQSLLERISQEKSSASPTQTFDEVNARQFLTVREDEGTWHEATDGVLVKQLFVDKERRTVTSLYKLLPGAQAVPHLHAGAEQCYVLAGDFEVNDEVLGPGDFTRALAGSFHHVARTQGGALLLIVEQANPEMLAQL